MVKENKHLGKYIDIRTDFGMKFYFGREENKILLIEFLNSLFEGKKIITDLNYTSVEHDGDSPESRRVVFDLKCTGANGEHFIIEMQQLHQDFFRDRAVYYTSRLINHQLSRGKKSNNYQLPEIYFIGILEFGLEGVRSVSHDTDRPYYMDVGLCDLNTHEVFYDKLGYKIISLPYFEKESDELHTVMDQWIYLLKYLSTMDKMPTFLDKRIFELIFEIGEIGKLTKEERMSYESSLKQKRDFESVLESARRAALAEGVHKGTKQGMKEGRQEGRMEERAKAELEKLATIRAMKSEGISMELIARITQLSVEEIQKILQSKV